MPTADDAYVELERSGGQLPTFKPKVRLELAKLSETDRKTLGRLVERAKLDHLPSPRSGASIPDAFRYRLTVNMQGHAHTVHFGDQDGHPSELDDLAEWIRAKGAP